jgi:antirestriction protein ArdC
MTLGESGRLCYDRGKSNKPTGANEMKNSKTAQATLEAIVERFKTGDLSPVYQLVHFHKDVPMSKWSFLNQLCVVITKNSFDARGFNQWKEVGRSVKKGAKATYILAPIFRKYTEENADGEEVQKEWLSGFRAVPVFAVEDTEGEPLVEPEITQEEPPALVEVAKALGIPVKYDATSTPILGCYKPNSNEIELYSSDPEVWYHELGHAVAEHVGAKFQDYNSNEVVAELTSAVLMMVYEHKDNTGNAWKYISAYSADPIQAVARAMKHVERILEFINSVQGGD